MMMGLWDDPPRRTLLIVLARRHLWPGRLEELLKGFVREMRILRPRVYFCCPVEMSTARWEISDWSDPVPSETLAAFAPLSSGCSCVTLPVEASLT